MATTPDRIFVNGSAHVFLGEVGTPAPTDPAGPFDAGLVEVGLFTEDSLNFSTEPNFEEVRSHQSDYPTRRMQTSDDATIAVDLQEWSGENFTSAYGGGQVTETGPGTNIFKYSPPTLGARQEKMCVVQCIDGDKYATLVVPRCIQVEGVEQDLGKGSEALLPLRLSILGSGEGDAWYWLMSDETAFAPAVGTATSILPVSGLAAGGTVVAITGTLLGGTTGITFGGVAATDVIPASSTKVYATTPAHAAGAVTVVLTTPAGVITKPTFYTYS